MVIHNWDSGTLSQERLLELLLRLDRPDALVAQSLATSGPRTAYFGQEVGNASQALRGSVGATAQGFEQSAPQALLQSSPVTEKEEARDEEQEEEDVEEESEDEFDNMKFDDDGLRNDDRFQGTQT